VIGWRRGDGVLMAFGACAAVEHRPSPLLHVVLPFHRSAGPAKAVAGWLGNSVALALGAGILDERGSIKARGASVAGWLRSFRLYSPCVPNIQTSGSQSILMNFAPLENVRSATVPVERGEKGFLPAKS